MRLETDIENQLAKSDELLKAIAEIKPVVPEYPTYANLGDLKRYNGWLEDVLEAFGGENGSL